MAVIILLLVMISICACGEQEYKIEKTNKTTIILNADRHAEMSRVEISGNKTDGFVTHWEAGDKIGAIAVGSGGEFETRSLSLTAESVAEDGVAKFTGTTDVNEAWSSSFVFYTYYPLVTDAPALTPESVSGEIPSEQTMTSDGSFDPAAAWMVGQPIEMSVDGSQTVELNTKFRHLNCFVNLSCRAITREDVSAEDAVRSVRLRVEGDTLSGTFNLDVTTGQYSFTAPSDYVCAELPSGAMLGNMSAWLVTSPFELGADETLVVEVITDAYTLRKQVSGRAMSFPTRNVVTLNLTLDESCTVTPHSVTYTINSDKTVTASGAVPEGATVTYKQLKSYVISSYPATLTLCGYDNYKVKGITVCLKANNNTAEARCEVRLGGEILSYPLNKDTWSEFSTSVYSPASLDFTTTDVGADLFEITIEATNGKFYISSFTIHYSYAR